MTCILSLVLISLNAHSTILEVGSDKAYKKISGALVMAEKGDTILVHEGLYREGSIDIRKFCLQVKPPEIMNLSII